MPGTPSQICGYSEIPSAAAHITIGLRQPLANGGQACYPRNETSFIASGDSQFKRPCLPGKLQRSRCFCTHDLLSFHFIAWTTRSCGELLLTNSVSCNIFCTHVVAGRSSFSCRKTNTLKIALPGFGRIGKMYAANLRVRSQKRRFVKYQRCYENFRGTAATWRRCYTLRLWFSVTVGICGVASLSSCSKAAIAMAIH